MCPWVKDQRRHYVIYLPDERQLTSFHRHAFIEQHDRHWQIEQYHRTIKQGCHIEQFQVRGSQAIKNHLFAAIYGDGQLQRLKALDLIRNGYRLRRDLFHEVIAAFIVDFMPGREKLNPHFQPVVNA